MFLVSGEGVPHDQLPVLGAADQVPLVAAPVQAQDLHSGVGTTSLVLIPTLAL